MKNPETDQVASIVAMPEVYIDVYDGPVKIGTYPVATARRLHAQLGVALLAIDGNDDSPQPTEP